MKRFGELFGESWREYKGNFRVFAIIFLLLAVIPALVYFFVPIFMFQPFSSELLALNQSGQTENLGQLSELFFSNINYFILLGVLLIIMVLFSMFMSASFIYNSLYRKKEMSVKETLLGGKKYFWKYFLFSIVYGIFLMGLFLLFIIPGLIFMVFWVFGFYVLIGENKGISESLKNSHKIVRGNWWKVFGFLILFGLIGFGISLGFSILGGIINLIIGIPAFIAGSSNIVLIKNFISQLVSLGARLITIPLGILFVKNFYLDMKGSKD